jgi:hypothetical protein
MRPLQSSDQDFLQEDNRQLLRHNDAEFAEPTSLDCRSTPNRAKLADIEMMAKAAQTAAFRNKEMDSTKAGASARMHRLCIDRMVQRRDGGRRRRKCVQQREKDSSAPEGGQELPRRKTDSAKDDSIWSGRLSDSSAGRANPSSSHRFTSASNLRFPQSLQFC